MKNLKHIKINNLTLNNFNFTLAHQFKIFQQSQIEVGEIIP